MHTSVRAATIDPANVRVHPSSCICCKAFPFALKLSNAVKMARTSTAKAGVAAEDAKAALLVEPEDACVARWAELEDSGLKQEVAKYRKAVIARERDLENVEPTNFEYEEEIEVEVEENGTPDDEAAAVATAEVEEEGKAEVEGKDGEEDGLIEGNVDDIDPSEWMVPPQCIPIHANVVTYDWSKLYENTDFDVIMMDPPWQLATANPTRGVSLGYSQLTDQSIADLPIPKLQKNGFLFVWVINAKYQWTLEQFKKWGYEFVDEIVWVKVTNSRRLAKSHGFYLQHAKEVCLVAAAARSPWHERQGCRQRYHLRPAPRTKPEAHRDLRAHRGDGPRREIPRDFRAQEQPPRLLGLCGQRGHRHRLAAGGCCRVRGARCRPRREVRCSQQ